MDHKLKIFIFIYVHMFIHMVCSEVSFVILNAFAAFEICFFKENCIIYKYVYIFYIKLQEIFFKVATTK